MWFIIQCGVITNFTWQKGGDQQLWSSENLPLEMTCTMTVEDLYPIAMSSERLTRLRYNTGLLSFLENMAGMNISQLSTTSFSNCIKQKAKLYMSKFNDGGMGLFGSNFLSPRSIINNLHDSRTDMASKLSGGIINGNPFQTAAGIGGSAINGVGKLLEHAANGLGLDNVASTIGDGVSGIQQVVGKTIFGEW